MTLRRTNKQDGFESKPFITQREVEMSDECQLYNAPHYQCCCNCKHHWQDNHHCGGCGIKKGYACVVFKVMDQKEGMIHSGWPEHSVGCEMYAALERLSA